jgi:hypothetical protein
LLLSRSISAWPCSKKPLTPDCMHWTGHRYQIPIAGEDDSFVEANACSEHKHGHQHHWHNCGGQVLGIQEQAMSSTP